MSNRFTRELKDPDTGRGSGREIWIRIRAAFAVLLSVGILAAGGWVVYDKVTDALAGVRTVDDYTGEGVTPVEVTIPKGSSINDIAEILVTADVVKTAKVFTREAIAAGAEERIQAGRYQLKTQMPAKLALEWLLDPERVVHNRMTLVEGQRLDQMVGTMADASGLPASDFNAVLKNWKRDRDDLGLPTWAKNSPEGFVFPDTYELSDKPNAKAMLTETFEQFSSVANDLNIEKRAKDVGLSPYQVVIVASIIDKEVFREQDRPKVARVIYNRLAQGMNLGLDSTAAYASWKAGLKKTNYNLDSPYNTRVNPGLPPGPIGSPARAALEAALSPAEGDWLYFVTVDLNSGETEFSEDEAGFQASVEKYQQWCAQSDENKKLCA